MLRTHNAYTKENERIPTASAAGFGLVTKPFKPLVLPTKRPERKRRINYAEGGEGHDDGEYKPKPVKPKGKPKGDDSDEEPKKNDFEIPRAIAPRQFRVYEVKPKETMFSRTFSIPPMQKDGHKVLVPLTGLTLGTRPLPKLAPRPLHDPMADHAIVLYDPTIQVPTEEEQAAALSETLNGPHKSLAEMLGIQKKLVVEELPVVIDPRLSKVLRPHQIEGVKFLYKCTTGELDEKANGCIMADEMGLGKTLQCITLMWTLLRQSPLPGKSTISKCIIACPASLVKNWANELVKWLGPGAVNALAVDGKQTREQLARSVRAWTVASGRGIVLPVLICSYEGLRNLVPEIGQAPIGLMLCDEGHRLKNSESDTFMTLNNLNCRKRVILTGTPVQNDLTEYFSLLNFANPDYLGTRNEFRKNYEIPILRGRDAEATEKERERSDEKLKELGTLVNKFIIRRTNDLLSKYLPVKYEHVVFCRLSELQTALYHLFITSPDIKKLLRGTGSQPLKAIGLLKKLCNHPDLLDLPRDLDGSGPLLPSGYLTGREKDHTREGSKFEYSGKFLVLERFLERMRRETNDKIVLISNYTQTLDIFEKIFRYRKWGHIRLDGTLSVNKRGQLVERFNNPEGSEFIFLLSSKAGGCGLNLIGANRLILFDPDWNPAADQQALARVWRDGQKKECFVYRFIATGTVEEQIFMRQSYKQSLSACVVDQGEDVERHFSKELMRELFQYHPKTTSHTHDTFKCKRCDKDGQHKKSAAMLYGDTSTWNHLLNKDLVNIHDDLLRAEHELPEISHVFQYISH